MRACIGIDVGSTTVKCVVVDPDTLKILWSRYERHETKQAEKVKEMLADIEKDFAHIPKETFQAFITGSGASPLVDPVGACFVQEVNAVSLAVEHLHPDVNSVIELGGQDAKIILFKENPETGERQIITSMNDKCASGTGATIDKCFIKVGMPRDEIAALKFNAGKLHHVAAKCGVFAETDIVNLIKSGVPSNEVMNSLADAIVMQNLSVLTRGNTLRSKVLLLGGPNTYLPFLQECWRLRIPETWEERGYDYPKEQAIDELIIVPDNAEYYAAFGSVVFGVQDKKTPPTYLGSAEVENFVKHGRAAKLGDSAGPPLMEVENTPQRFAENYQVPLFQPAVFEKGTHVRGYIGLDGGSTSSKAVLIDESGEIICKQYQLSKGNPIQDTKELLAKIKQYIVDQGCTVEVLGFGATGYAADVLEQSVKTDANIVETVAHMKSAQKYCGDDIDVICDIGGQDIKVMFMQNGVIKNFRLSNQCSAGNGMLLQAMADQFGVKVTEFADVAFNAKLSPKFSYGCAVFLDSDRVNFQKEGYSKEELFAGLAMVLPKNVWQYVVQIPRMGELGRKFVLQGGTQYNLAAVKAQVDYIKERVPDAQVLVHPHCGEAGAIGAALEAKRVVERKGSSTFIGLDAAIDLHYTSRTDESTRCNFCENLCSRTFIDTTTPSGETTRYIAGFSCEKGTVESKEAVVKLNKERKRLKAVYPNLVDYEGNFAFKRVYKTEDLPEAGAIFDDEKVYRNWFGYGEVKRKSIRRPFQRSSDEAMERRKNLRIGIPRVLNIYTLAPFLRAYLEALGINQRNVVFSDETSEELWLEGGKYGSIDPCYPSKVSLAHFHNLFHAQQRRKPLDYIWFPAVTHLRTFVSHTMSSATCPIVAGAPEVAAAAFTKERDFFADQNIEYVRDALDFDAPELLRKHLFMSWGERLGITKDESDWACEQGYRAMDVFDQEMQRRGLEILTHAEKENKVVLLMLGRPYHNDPGLNHDILEEFQTLGYPVLSIRSIPKDEAYLRRYFKNDLEKESIKDVFDINDVWPENYSTNSVQKVWAAKFAARHPHVAVIDFSSFKCGHDAPTYGLIDSIISNSKTPYSALHDLDANKPGGSIKIRVKTYGYALSLYQEMLEDKRTNRSELESRIEEKRQALLEQHLTELNQYLMREDSETWSTINDLYEEFLNKSNEKILKEYNQAETKNNGSSIQVDFSNNLLNRRDDMVVQQAKIMREKAQEIEEFEQQSGQNQVLKR